MHGVVTQVYNGSRRGEANVAVQLDSDSLTFDELVQQLPTHDIWPPTVTFDTDGRLLCTGTKQAGEK